METPAPGSFEDLSLEALRARRSAKWQTHPADVLPAWVAEMDFPLAAPIRATLLEAVERDDCGYPNPGPLREAFAAWAGDRYGWHVDPERVRLVPDVTSGIVGPAPRAHGSRRRGRRQPADLPAVLQCRARGRAPARRGAARRGRHRLRARPRSARARVRERRGRLPALQPAQPDRPGVHPRGAGQRRRAGGQSRRARALGRDPRAADTRGRDPYAVRLARRGGGRARADDHEREQGLEHRRPEVRGRRLGLGGR